MLPCREADAEWNQASCAKRGKNSKVQYLRNYRNLWTVDFYESFIALMEKIEGSFQGEFALPVENYREQYTVFSNNFLDGINIICEFFSFFRQMTNDKIFSFELDLFLNSRTKVFSINRNYQILLFNCSFNISFCVIISST